MTTDSLDPNAMLSFLIGEIIRNDEFASRECRGVWHALARSETVSALIPRDFGRVLQDCQSMVPASSLAEEKKALVGDALATAKSAHEERNQLAHDQWLLYVPSDEVWHSAKALTNLKRGQIATRGLVDFETCRTDLLRAGWRLRGLTVVLPAWFGEKSLLDDLDAGDERFWNSVAEGRFALTDGSIAEIPANVPTVRDPAD